MAWHALFIDGSDLSQFNKNGNEIPFGEVIKKVKELRALSIHLKERQYVVSLLDGMFNIENKCIYILDTNKYPPKELKNIRPIYFERWQQDFNVSTRQPSGQKLLFTALGFQAIFEGKNIKRYLEIYQSGDIKVRES